MMAKIEARIGRVVDDRSFVANLTNVGLMVAMGGEVPKEMKEWGDPSPGLMMLIEVSREAFPGPMAVILTQKTMLAVQAFKEASGDVYRAMAAMVETANAEECDDVSLVAWREAMELPKDRLLKRMRDAKSDDS